MDLAALPEEIRRFARWLESERRASPHTLKAYLGDLAGYAGYLEAAGVPLVPSSPLAVRGWLGREAGTSGPSSLGRKLCSRCRLQFSLFLSFLLCSHSIPLK